MSQANFEIVKLFVLGRLFTNRINISITDFNINNVGETKFDTFALLFKFSTIDHHSQTSYPTSS